MDQTCNNCNNLFNTTYCPACGQKADVGRLTIHSLVHELWHGFTHTDKGVLKLWTDLLVRPGTAYHNYFRGKRKSYFSPVVFFLLSFGLYIFFDQKVFDYQDHINFVRTGHLYNNEVGRYMQEQLKYIALTLLPFQSFLTLAFYYKRANLAECIVFWLFCVGFINTLMILLTPVRLLLIDYKGLTEYVMSLLVIAVYVIHLAAAFGGGLLTVAKAVALTFVVSMLNTYIWFFYFHHFANVPYPDFVQAVKVTFANSSVNFYNGKTIIK